MKVHVDPDLCVGDESCVEICPEIFEMRGETAVARMETVPRELEERCREAAEVCPVEAIVLEG
jgi:ferredoxin